MSNPDISNYSLVESEKENFVKVLLEFDQILVKKLEICQTKKKLDYFTDKNLRQWTLAILTLLNNEKIALSEHTQNFDQY